MLKIVSPQWQALQSQALEAFEQRTVRHLAHYFPRRAALAGEAALQATVRLGLERARAHHLDTEACVRCYVEAMLLMGSHFDTDPLLPWAARTLADPSTEADPLGRGDRLHAQVWAFAERVAPDTRAWAAPGGPPGLAEALRQLRDEPLHAASPEATADAVRRCQPLLWRLFPARFSAVGEAAVAAHLQRSPAAAERCGLEGPRGTALAAVLGFALGHGFDRDPLLPWVADALAPAPAGPAGDRAAAPAADRLFAALVAQLRHASAAGDGTRDRS